MKVYNYMRVSTLQQHTERQKMVMAQNPVPGSIDIIEKRSAKKGSERKELEKLLLNLQPGDTIRVASLDRFSRSLQELLETIEIIKEKQATLYIIDYRLEITGDRSKHDKKPFITELIVNVLASVAEMERNMLIERQRLGFEAIRLGKQKLRTKDSKRKMLSFSKIHAILKGVEQNHLSTRKAAEIYGVSHATVARIINRYYGNQHAKKELGELLKEQQ